MERAEEIVCVVDAQRRLLFASPSYERVTGVSPQDVLGRNDSHEDGTSPADRARIVAAIDRACAHPTEQPVVEYRGRHADGSTRWREMVVTNLLDDPVVEGVVLHIRDITDRRRAETEVRFRATLIDAIGQPVIVTRPDGIVQFWNDAATEMFGWDADEAVGRHLSEVTTGPQVWAELMRRVEDEIVDDTRWTGDVVLRRKDGSSFPAQITNARLRNAHGEVVGNIGVTTDLTEQVRLRENLRLDQQRLAETQRIANVGSFETEADGTPVWSEELYDILGLPTDLPPSLATYREQVHPDDRPALREELGRHVYDGRDLDVTHRVVRPDGELRWVNLRGRAGRPGQQVSVAVLDVTTMKRTQDELVFQARHDALTGIANRTWLTTQLATLLDGLTDDAHVHVALLDIDQFKFVNASFGHRVGDLALCELAARVGAATRPDDVVGRFGGDELLVVRAEADHHGEDDDLGAALAADLADALAEPIVVDGRRLSLSASIGVSTGRRHDDADQVLRDADSAMHAAKERGKAQYYLFDEKLRARARRRLEIEAGLQSALDDNEVRVHFQPVVDLGSGTTVGLEALARWEHPTLGTVAPEEFVPVAEDRGLILRLGDQVLRAAAEQLAAWRRAGTCGPAGDRLWVAVNLSARQLAIPNLAEVVATVLSQVGLPPENLHLEITESVLMDDVDVSFQVTRALRALGIRISVDDFGTGYSSLAYLKRLPVSTIKVDRSFVTGVGRDPHDTAIVSAVVDLAHGLGMTVIAEGVEQEEQHTALHEIGCAFGQGYLWGRPVDGPAAGARLGLVSTR